MDRKKEIDDLRRAYQSVFSGPNGEKVLADLAAYCGEYKDLFSTDALAMAHNTGVRKVFLRIVSFMSISRNQIWELMNNAGTTISSEPADTTGSDVFSDDRWPE